MMLLSRTFFSTALPGSTWVGGWCPLRFPCVSVSVRHVHCLPAQLRKRSPPMKRAWRASPPAKSESFGGHSCALQAQPAHAASSSSWESQPKWRGGPSVASVIRAMTRLRRRSLPRGSDRFLCEARHHRRLRGCEQVRCDARSHFGRRV